MTVEAGSAVVFMGTPSFSVPFLNALLKSGRRVAGVLTQPDKPRGRGQRLTIPPVKEFAIEHKLSIFQPGRLSDPSVIEQIKRIHPEYIVVVAYGKIVPAEILRIPEKGCINVHASLLPEYRGASPIQWAIIEGRTYTGVTTMVMAETLDTGDILLQEGIGINRSDTAGGLSIRLSEIGVALLVRTLDGLDRGELIPRPQDHAKATYAPLLKKEDGLIDWGAGSEEIFNKIRGFDPWPGAYTFYKGGRWGVWRAEVHEKRGSTHSPGEIIRAQPDGIVVATGDGALKITEIQAEGKRRMPVAEYLRGHKVERGVILGSGEGKKY
ncbi:MAG: methionyl-tRNA formyltransferase [Nitrospirae bacterium]|nr:methionyl-tRNA formyltransferase [Nitrospirota bacterium]